MDANAQNNVTKFRARPKKMGRPANPPGHDYTITKIPNDLWRTFKNIQTIRKQDCRAALIEMMRERVAGEI